MVRQINGLAKLFTLIGWFNHPMCMHTCKGWITDWFYTLRTCTGWRCFVLLHFNTMNCFHTSMPCPPPPTYRPDWKILLCLRKGSGGSSWSTWSFFLHFFWGFSCPKMSLILIFAEHLERPACKYVNFTCFVSKLICFLWKSCVPNRPYSCQTLKLNDTDQVLL